MENQFTVKRESRIVSFYQLYFLIVWVGYLFYPIISSTIEVAWVELTRPFTYIDWLVFTFFWQWPEYSIDFLFSGLILLYLVVFVIYFRWNYKKWTPGLIKHRLLSVVIIPILWLVVFPIGNTYYERVRNSYKFGGEILLIYAGGGKIVRNDALDLLASGIDGKLTEGDLPESLRRFGRIVKINQEQQTIEIFLGSACGMCGLWEITIFDDRDGTRMPPFFEPDYMSDVLLFDDIYLIHK